MKTIKQLAMVAMPCMMLSAPLVASDYDIYKATVNGQKTAMILLDASGSMGSNGRRYNRNADYADSIWEDYRDSPTVATPGDTEVGKRSPWASAAAYDSAGCRHLTNWRTINGGITAPRADSKWLPDLKRTLNINLEGYTMPENAPYFYKTYCAGVVKDDDGIIDKNYIGEDVLLKDYSKPVSVSNVLRDSNGNALKAYYDRMTRLKEGIFTFLEDTFLADKEGSSTGRYIKNKNAFVGLAQFSTAFDANNNVLSGFADGVSGHIWVPAAPLEGAQRIAIANAVIQFDNKKAAATSTYPATMPPFNGTPTANGYAEVAAYLMGKRTSGTGSGFSNSVSSAKNGSFYNSPLAPAATLAEKQCSSQGIYILTDGFPNSANVNSTTEAQSLMRVATGYNAFTCGGSSSNLADTDSTSGWKCMGSLAQWLNSEQNIKTATAGFGFLFNNRTSSTSLQNCSGGTVDGQNLCKLGGGVDPDIKDTSPSIYGGGGAYAVDDALGVADSLADFLSRLPDPVFQPLPTGRIAVPKDGFDSGVSLPYAYMQLLQADANTKMLWQGNVKKYNVTNQTYWGENVKPVFNDIYGALNKDSTDYWTLANPTTGQKPVNGDKIDQGGAVDNIPYPVLNANDTSKLAQARPVFSDAGLADSNSPLLPIGKPTTGTTAQDAVYTFIKNTSSPLSQDQRMYLANYLGYNLDTSNYSSLTKASDLLNYLSSSALKLMGGVVHSTPVYLSYEAKLDSNFQLLPVLPGQNNRPRDYVMFGSNDGGLHVVDAVSGTEKFVFVPQTVINQQAAAFRKNSIATTTTPRAYGVDAPWVADSEASLKEGSYLYNVDPSNSDDRMFVYGGLRMGGEGLYGLDLTNITNPRLLFKKDHSSAGYSRLGQTWAKPTVAKVRLQGLIKKVLIVTGGYDTCYEDPTIDCNVVTRAGNAIYLIDITDKSNSNFGKPLWTITNATGTSMTNVPSMTHSIVSTVTTLDRNQDGLVDHLYVGDLAGQVFRVDIDNARQKDPTKIQALVTNAVVVADVGKGLGRAAYRFYTPPIVKYYDSTFDNVFATAFVTVSIASGNRSSPLNDVTRVSEAKNDALFTFIDKDVARTDFFAAPATVATTVLADLRQDPNSAAFVSGKKGWYRTYVDPSRPSPISGSTASSKNGSLKSFEPLVRLNNQIYVPIFDPTYITTGEQCAGGVYGASFVRAYCLPYGYCSTSINGSASNGSYWTSDTVMGQGIGGVSVSSVERPCDPTKEYCDAALTAVKEPQLVCIGANCPVKDSSPAGVPIERLRWFRAFLNSDASGRYS